MKFMTIMVMLLMWLIGMGIIFEHGVSSFGVIISIVFSVFSWGGIISAYRD